MRDLTERLAATLIGVLPERAEEIGQGARRTGAQIEALDREIAARVVSIDPLAHDWPGTLRATTDALVDSFAP
jgi:hypothetical protein